MAAILVVSCTPQERERVIYETVREFLSEMRASFPPTPTPITWPTPLSTASTRPLVLLGKASGTGDTVVDRTLSAGINRITMAQEGQRNFTVAMYDDEERRESLANEIGRYSGTVVLRVGVSTFDLIPGPCVLGIAADGSWTIEMAQ